MNQSADFSKPDSPEHKRTNLADSNSAQSKSVENDSLIASTLFIPTESENSSYHFIPRQWPIDLEEIFVEIRTISVQLPCLIVENITFEKFVTLRDHDLFHYLEFVEEKSICQVFVVEIPSDEHEEWASKLAFDLMMRYPTLETKGRGNVYYTEKLWTQPDQSFRLADIQKIRYFDDGSLNDCAGKLAPVLVIESAKSVTLAETIKKFKEKFFKVNGCRVGLIMDFNTTPKDLSLYKVVRDQKGSSDLQITKSTDGKITILNTELYPKHNGYQKVSRKNLPNILIDLKSPIFDRICKITYAGYTVDGTQRKIDTSSDSDVSYESD